MEKRQKPRIVAYSTMFPGFAGGWTMRDGKGALPGSVVPSPGQERQRQEASS